MTTRLSSPTAPIDAAPADTAAETENSLSLEDLLSAGAPSAKKVAMLSMAVAIVTYGITLLLPPTFTARTTIISPQQQQNSASAALASLGALAGLAGSNVLKSPADQYVSVMQSVTIGNRIIDRFKLMDVYESRYRVDALKALNANVRINAGKKDNLITIDVDDDDPSRAAQMANAYVEELRWITNRLALTEAQQRRAFFEQQLQQTKTALKLAQLQVQKTGFTAGALKSEPKSAAEAYARAKAEIAGIEVRLGALRKTLTESAPEIQQQLAALSGLRAQLAQLEQPMAQSSDQDYVSAYREFKYQEALFEIFAKQFELAKMDESREGTLIQVLDAASPPEKRSKPKRMIVSASAAVVAGLGFWLFFAIRELRRRRAA